jgi:signal transduction histidine kinase
VTVVDRPVALPRPSPDGRPLSRPGSGSAGRPRWTLRRIFVVGAGVAVLLSVVAVALGALALSRLGEARTALVDRVAPALLSAQDLSVALLDQETGVRGFAITGSGEFLAPYRDGLSAERDALAALRSAALGGDVEALGRNLDGVEEAALAWRAGYAEPTIGAPQGAAPDAEVGRELFQEVRVATEVLLADLERERVVAREALSGAAGFLFGVGVAITAVLAAFLVAAAIGLRRGVLVPVSRLAAQVREVVSGDVQREVRGGGPREIVELGADVEAMRVHILGELDRQQEANRRLDEQARELERSNRDLEQFAYVASHDLQEPLRKVSSFCQLLQRRYGGQLDERADQYIGFAVDGAHRMQQLINDLLSFSRVGRTTAGLAAVDLGEVAASAAGTLEAARVEALGEIVLGDLPVVRGDRALLQLLLANLLGNGLKFRRAGVPPVVRLGARPSGETWEIAVADNGIGIEPEYADKVFVIFQRLHGRDRYPGTGIGLAMAKKIVEFHGGRIWLDEPTDEPGTTVRFTLPAALPPSDEGAGSGTDDTGLAREPGKEIAL